MGYKLENAECKDKAVTPKGNTVAFTGRTLDILDNGALKLMYYRNRYYSPFMGRMLTPDPLGQNNLVLMAARVRDTLGNNLYEYVQSKPVDQIDPSGLLTWPSLENDEYELGTTPPEDSDWEHGEWNVGKDISNKEKRKLHNLMIDFRNASRIHWFINPDAARFMLHYFDNTGTTLDYSAQRMLEETDEGKTGLIKHINNALNNAEKLIGDKCQTPIDIVQKGFTRFKLADDNWGNAIGTYSSWGEANITNLGGELDPYPAGCCYMMVISLNYWDNYEWQKGIHYEFWAMNHYGIAQHFKSRARISFSIGWRKGDRIDKSDVTRLIKDHSIRWCGAPLIYKYR